MRRYWCVIFSILLSGCSFSLGASSSPESIAEKIKAQSATYPGVSRVQVLEAIEKLFELADPNHRTLITAEGITISRNFIAIAGMSETWEIHVTERQGSIEVFASANAISAGVMLPANAPFYYEPFFTRLGYLLGKSDQWETCTEYETRTSNKWKTHDFLCWSSADQLPKSLYARYGVKEGGSDDWAEP